MTITLRVTERGLAAAAAEIEYVSRRLEDLTPTAWMIRARWHESERRSFKAGRWRARKRSTVARYRRGRIKTGMGGQARRISSPRGGTLILSGRLRTGVTQPHQRGQLDRVRRTGSGLTVTLGVQHNGPLGYAATNAKRRRDPIEIDTQAVAAATEDVSAYIVTGRTGRWTR